MPRQLTVKQRAFIAAYLTGIPATQAGKPGADIDAVRAWDLATGNINTIVAVLDTGLDLANPEFTNRIWSNPRDAWTAGTVVPAPGVVCFNPNAWFAFARPVARPICVQSALAASLSLSVIMSVASDFC